MPMVDIEYPDLGGGISDDAAPAGMARSQFEELVNFYPYDTKIRRRGGAREMGTWAASKINTITGIHPRRRRSGMWALIVGSESKFGKLNGSVIETIPIQPYVVIGGSSLPWVIFQYKEYLYAVRNGGNGEMFRITETQVDYAGIPPPTSAPVIAQGAAGDLPAGNYKAAVRFGNRATGYRGNLSPISNTLALAASKKIDYSSIPTSTNTFFNLREVFRTLENQSGVYFKVFELNDDSTTTYTGENVTVDLLGDPASFKLGQPPSQLRTACVFAERVFASDGRDLFYSEVLQGEGFGADNIISIFPDDGGEIRALHALEDRLIIGKTNQIHYLVGNSANTFGLHTLSDKHGCMSHHSMQSAEGVLLWYGSGQGIFRSEGSGAKDISTPRIRKTLKQIPPELEEQIVGAIYPPEHLYLLSVPHVVEGSPRLTENNAILLVYNYRTDAWATFDQVGNAPKCIGQFFNELGQPVLYSSHYDPKLYQYHDTSQDFDGTGPLITASFLTKPDDFDAPGYRKTMNEAWLMIPKTPNASIRLEVKRDELAGSIESREVSLNVPDSAWKAFKLSTQGGPGTLLQLKGTYSGPIIDIEQMKFKINVLSRAPRVH